MKIPRITTTMVILLVLFFFVPGVYGLKMSVSSGSSSYNYDHNVANDASLDGKISIDKLGVHPSSKITNPVVPNKKKLYGKWNAKWWQWAFSMPVEGHPLVGDGVDLSKGQSGNVWFLGSSITSTEPSGSLYDVIVNRQGEIPAGTTLFIPLWNIELSTIEGNGVGRELKDGVESYMDPDYFKEMTAAIDGKPIGSSVLDFEEYKAPSDLFKFGPLPDDNALQAIYPDNPNDYPEGAISQSAADGYYLMLHPLTPGEHTITWTSTYDNNAFRFAQRVEYDIAVKKGNCKD